MKTFDHQFDFCVVGGGMAGMIAAIAAARHGARVALVQDRPVLGGNASSEVRMHVSGAHGPNNRETGILEELCLENHYRNPEPNYHIWDSVLYGKARYQENLTLFLNASVNACEMDGPRIKSVTAWQLTTETWHTIRAAIFADCSGDGVLAPLSGADYRVGREARNVFGESIAPVEGDRKTMGMSCLLQAREHSTPQTFVPPDWAYTFTRPEDLRGRLTDLRRTNFWWMEVGGEQDSIHDTERLRDELLKIAFGVWDYIKNHAPDREEFAHWALDWQGFLPGKRESRRYVGDHVLTQRDIESEGRFDDLVAYGGWTMDDHFPEGFYHPEAGTIFHPAPSPFGICYRSLYSRNIENLFCAGRNHSASHAAMSATRVMGTTSLMGQAVGTAAAIAVRSGGTPRSVGRTSIRELQRMLMDDDCWLPWHVREIPELSKRATLTAGSGNPDALRNGTDRPIGNEDNGWTSSLGEPVTYAFARPTDVVEARIVFDSDLNRQDPDAEPGRGTARNMRHCYRLKATPWSVPASMIKEFRVDIQDGTGAWRAIWEERNNYQRLVRVPIRAAAKAVRLTPLATWGAESAHIFAFDIR